MPSNLTPEQMKQLVADHFKEFVNDRNVSVIRKNMTPDFFDHDGPGGKPTGVDGDEAMMRKMYELMPDLHLTIEDIIAEGDKVMCRNIWRWTDTQSKKKMQFHGFVLWRLEGDKIAERWATVTNSCRRHVVERIGEAEAMKVTLYGSTGKAGTRILRELLSRGHTVTAVAREPGKFGDLKGFSIVTDDLSDVNVTSNVIKGADAVISAYAPPLDNTDALITVTGMMVEAVKKSNVPRF